MRTHWLSIFLLSACSGASLPLADGGNLDFGADAAPDGGSLKWYSTCGDPSCHLHRDAGVTPCTTEQANTACTTTGAECDPGNDCNSYLLCTNTDPKSGTGGCPISRARYKQDIRYLGGTDLQKYHDELLQLRLAKYRYRAHPERERIGFLLDDNELSVAADPERDMVDLYGYTSLAVAALKVQAKEIDDLRTQLADIKTQLKKLRRTEPRRSDSE